MIPKRGEWITWGTREKIEYAGQIATLATLFATVFFSAMGWKEAREASYLQRQTFLADSSPRLILHDARIVNYGDGDVHLQIVVKNTGGSKSRSFCLNAIEDNSDKKIFRNFFSVCDKPFSDITIAKGETFKYAFRIRNEQRQEIGFSPTSAIVLDDEKERRCKARYGFPLYISLRWTDSLGEEDGSFRTMFLCK